MVLSGSPATYAESVDQAVDIEESLLEAQAPIQPSVGRSFQPVQDVSQSFQSPQGSHQSSRQRFKPRGKQFKKKAHSSSSGSVSSGGSSSGACPLMGGQSLGQSQQGSAGGSSQRQQPFFQSQRSEF
ncbi:hypothetical protein F511_14090 [Dorcoceras hygrometricum]|uniref:Uncharacterized protein n=1 Tax=Dorcoceras hygrometricum TaxID=472368 RepID=A0A2Z7BUJ2_9LAMI|nr:hypothetical protein F511_14090 [Dorcoceras hygrometricum]